MMDFKIWLDITKEKAAFGGRLYFFGGGTIESQKQ